MAKLEDYIAPGEPILWRTPTHWQVMKRPLWVPGVLMAFGVVMQLISSEPDFFGFLFWMPLAWMAIVAAYPFGDWSEVFLTERRLVFLRRFRRPRIQATDRRDIRELEIFAGAGLMAVHGRHESLRPVRFIGEPLELARELDLPTTLWRPFDAPKKTGRPRKLEILSWFVVPGVILIAVSGVMAAVLMGVAAYPGWPTVRETIAGDFVGLGLGAALVVSLGLGFIAGQVVMGGLRRLFLSKDEMKRLRCEDSDPLWRGEMPAAAPRTGLAALGRYMEDSYYRLAYGPQEACEPPEPERYEPGAFPPPEAGEAGKAATAS